MLAVLLSLGGRTETEHKGATFELDSDLWPHKQQRRSKHGKKKSPVRIFPTLFIPLLGNLISSASD